MKLSDKEIEFMEILWNAKKPLSGSEIVKASVDKTWKDSSIHILINSLLKKCAIREAGFVRTGKGYGRTFEAVETREQYYAELVVDIANKTSLSSLFSALTSSEYVSEDTIEELERILLSKKWSWTNNVYQWNKLLLSDYCIYFF